MSKDNLEKGLETLIRVIKVFDKTQHVVCTKTDYGYELYFNGTDIQLNNDGTLSGCGSMCTAPEDRSSVLAAVNQIQQEG